MPLTTDPIPFILQATGAKRAEPIETVQTLWSGYGQILRFQLYGCDRQTVIVKLISPPESSQHPRGWNTNAGHQRKLKSYQVETAWYQTWTNRCTEDCYVPQCLGVDESNDTIILLEDLDVSGYPLRVNAISGEELKPCLSWLAHFHACFMGEKPEGLWPIGTYWHLDTRPDELSAMEDGRLKQMANEIDKKLNDARFQTLVHGDAKIANFCFANDRTKVAAVDFQYVGGGCGMKDLTYFLGSCLSETDCEQQQSACLDFYFHELKNGLEKQNKPIEFSALEEEWRYLFPVAWADFYRFLQGWMPSHNKINSFSTRLTEQVLTEYSFNRYA